MEKDRYKTKICFRILEGEIIALMPDAIWSYGADGKKYITSYMLVGQHGAADPSLVLDLPHATPEQYNDVLEELKSFGYNLEVID